MNTSKAYELHVHTRHMIPMEGIALKVGKINTLGTSETNVPNASKLNTLSLLYVPSHASCICRLILLWEEIHLKIPLTLLLK